MKIKYKNVDCYLKVQLKCGFGEKFITNDIDFFARKNVKGFLKIREIKKKKIEYEGIKAIPLSERLKSPLTKHEFFFILEQFLIAMEELELRNLSFTQVLFSLHNVFITETTKEIQLLYVTIEKKENIITAPLDFIEVFIYSTQPAQETDMEYISRFACFMKTQSKFNVSAIENFIKKEDIQSIKLLKNNDLEENAYRDKSENTELLYQVDNRTRTTSNIERRIMDNTRTGLEGRIVNVREGLKGRIIDNTRIGLEGRIVDNDKIGLERHSMDEEQTIFYDENSADQDSDVTIMLSKDGDDDVTLI